jgi:hypothetical protein
LQITEDELVNHMNWGKAFGMLELIREFEKKGKLSHSEAENLRKTIEEKYHDDYEKVKKMHDDFRFDPFKEFKNKHPW